MTRNPLLILIGAATAVLPASFLFLSLNIFFFVPLLVGLGCVFIGCRKSPEAGKELAMRVGLFLCLTATIGPFALAEYFDRPGKPIKIVLPDAFIGEFSIIKERQQGQDLKWQNGAWLFEIPPSGVLVVNDDHPFYRWHQESVVYSDGRPAMAESLGVAAGRITTGHGSLRGSTDYDGTEHRWKVLGAPQPRSGDRM